MRRTRNITGIAAVALAASLTVGCTAKPKVVEQPVKPTLANIESLRAAALAINTNDLDTARRHIEAAKQAAMTEAGSRKAADLERLVEGADALKRGEIEAAQVAWGAIQDPALMDEVQRRASDIGITVTPQPLAVAGDENLNTLAKESE